MKLLLPVIALFFGCGCVFLKSRTPAPRQSALTHSARTYSLGKVPDQDRERAFQDLLAAAQARAARGDSAAGFSYSLAPKGAVYPFSEVEVVCLVQRSDSGSGDDLCSDFFKAVDAGLGAIVYQE